MDETAGQSGTEAAPRALTADDLSYRRTIFVIAAMVCVILAVETLYGVILGSRFLIRDGLEWIYDVLIYCFAALAFGRGAVTERRMSLASAAALAAAGVETLGQIVWTFIDPPAIDLEGVSISTGLIIAEALLVAALLWRFRRSRNPLVEATWLSARNDVATSTLSAFVTMAARLTPSSWPQMAVDAFGAILCFQAAIAVARQALADQNDVSRRR